MKIKVSVSGTEIEIFASHIMLVDGQFRFYRIDANGFTSHIFSIGGPHVEVKVEAEE